MTSEIEPHVRLPEPMLAFHPDQNLREQPQFVRGLLYLGSRRPHFAMVAVQEPAVNE